MLKRIARTLIEGGTMFIVAALSLLLLLYVGFGDGKRTYELLHIEKLTAQGLFAQTSIEKFLRDGLPLKQYVGFSTLATPIVEGEDVDAVLVYDDKGQVIFTAMDKVKPTLPEPAAAIKNIKEKIEIEYGKTHYQVVLPLRNRFETVGSVVVVSPTRLVTTRLIDSFYPLPMVGAVLSLLFAITVLLAGPFLRRTKGPWLQFGYGVTFLLMAGLVVGTLVSLYFDGVQGKAKASAFTLSQRLSDIIEFKLNVKDFDGLDRSFAEYRKLNPEISEAALLIDNSVQITTEAAKVGKTWNSDDRNFEYKVNLSPEDKPRYTNLTVTVPRDVVFERVLRSVKNFAALFIASAFLSGLFLQVASSIQNRTRAQDGAASGAAPGAAPGALDAGLVIVKPVFFLAVFLDSLTYSFLPKFMQEAAVAADLSRGFASMPFTAYYLTFALTLIPAGSFCDRKGPKPVMLIGLLLAAGSVLALALPLDLWAMTGLRAVAGIGQGMLMIGVQSYILAVVPPEKKTQGAAIIVFGFQGGMIAGMALGSLMVNFLNPQGVFMIAGGVGATTLLYTLAMIPLLPLKKVEGGFGAAVKRLGNDLKKVVTSLEFLKILFFIGAPAKAILTGVITFAIPLILGQAGYRSEDIGQVVMLYGLGVVASTGYVSKLVDRTKNTEAVLFWGAIMSGLGLVMIGLLGTPLLPAGWISTAVVVAGVSLVGIAHGFINAPVVSHVTQSELAKRLGANPVTTTYRFLERGGHVAGPLLLSQFFLLWGQGPHIIGAIGVGTAVLGLLFVAHKLMPRQRSLRAEPAE
jgi:MFS family permease